MVRRSPRLVIKHEAELAGGCALTKAIVKARACLVLVKERLARDAAAQPDVYRLLAAAPTAIIGLNASGRGALFEHLFEHGGWVLQKCACGTTKKTIVPVGSDKWKTDRVVCDECATVHPATFVVPFVLKTRRPVVV